MKIKDIVIQYGIDSDELYKFLNNSNYTISGLFEHSVRDDEVSQILSEFRQYELFLEEERLRLKEDERLRLTEKRLQSENERDRKKQEELGKKTALKNMLITSGFSFDGYTIVKYSGYISGDDAISVDRGFVFFGGAGNVKDKLMESLVLIRRNALAELKEAAYALGCNAVIGVDYDYITLDPQTANVAGQTVYQPYVFGVTANGNAVIIEKNE